MEVSKLKKISDSVLEAVNAASLKVMDIYDLDDFEINKSEFYKSFEFYFKKFNVHKEI